MFLPIETNYQISPDSLLVFTMQAIDYDSTELVITYIDSIPTGAEFVDSGNGSATFSWLPDSTQIGWYFVDFMVTDTTNLSDTLEVIIQVLYSSVNYKDDLSASGNRGVTKNFPHTPGIDAAGIVRYRGHALPRDRDAFIDLLTRPLENTPPQKKPAR